MKSKKLVYLVLLADLTASALGNSINSTVTEEISANSEEISASASSLLVRRKVIFYSSLS
ncbi:hypothetical protein [Clostridium sp. BJN0013]|uniref:hypothetical protein n=1 Tax=Clostridium sp. BJN0013 TaxID=3236840 RepID=UPI0034C624E7